MAMQQDLLNANIIELLGLNALPEAEKKAMLDKMSELLMGRVMLRVMESMTDEQLAQMPKEGSNPEELLTFVAENVPNFQSIMEEEAVKLKEQVVKAAEQV
jgi:hypothetical protein